MRSRPRLLLTRERWPNRPRNPIDGTPNKIPFRPVSYENRIILRAIILNTHPGGKLVAGRVGRHSNSTNWKNRFFRVRVYHSDHFPFGLEIRLVKRKDFHD